MYHDEQEINGVLHWRGTPNGEWKPCTLEQLTERVRDLQREIAETRLAIAEVA